MYHVFRVIWRENSQYSSKRYKKDIYIDMEHIKQYFDISY